VLIPILNVDGTDGVGAVTIPAADDVADTGTESVRIDGEVVGTITDKLNESEALKVGRVSEAGTVRVGMERVVVVSHDVEVSVSETGHAVCDLVCSDQVIVWECSPHDLVGQVAPQLHVSAGSVVEQSVVEGGGGQWSTSGRAKTVVRKRVIAKSEVNILALVLEAWT